MFKRHILHLFEDRNLTFVELKNIFSALKNNQITEVYEKFDGANLLFSWNNITNELRCARNQGDIALGGLNEALLRQKFADRENLSNMFGNAYRAINEVLRKFEGAEKIIFPTECDIWLSCEVLDNENPNTIHYENKNIVLHKTGYSALSDRKTIEEKCELLFNKINNLNENFFNTNWKLNTPKRVNLSKMEDKIFNEFIHKLNMEIIRARLNENNTIEDYLFSFVRRKLSKELPTFSNEKLEGATKKILQKPNNLTRQEVIKLNQIIKQSNISISETIFPLEKIIHDFGCELLKGQKSFFITEHQKEVNRLKAFAKQVIESVRNFNSYEYLHILNAQMKKLRDTNNINASLEGIVFIHNDNIYKMTSNYSPINKIKNINEKLKKIKSGVKND